MMAAFFKIFLMASGCLFWITVCAMLVLEKRSRRFLTKHKEEWPEPIFRQMAVQSSVKVDVLFTTLRRDAIRLGEVIAACRKGSGLIAIEDTAIRDEINKVLEALGLMVIEKE